MVRDIYLYGQAGRLFGRHFRLDVASPREAARALVMLRPGLRALLRNGLWRVIVGQPRLRNGINLDALGMRLGSQPLHLVPVTRPRGSSGGDIGKIAIGVVIIGTAILLAMPTGGFSLAAGTGLAASLGATSAIGITYGAIAAIGVSMVLAGVAGLLTPQMSQAPTDGASSIDTPSFLFNGVTNNTQPGGPVPLVYGTMLTGSVVVSTSLQVTDIPQWYT
jgi:predicted phage tail protein